MTDREAFEAFITAPPFERSASRFDDRGAWPGSYINYETDLAWKAWQAATAHERERCVDIIECYRVPVGNSSAGEMAAEWTMDALEAIRDAIRKVE